MWIWNVRFEGRIAIFLKQGVVDPPCRQGDFKSLKIHAPGKGGKNTLFLLYIFGRIIPVWVVRVQVAWTDVFGQSREGFCEHLDRKMLISVQNRPDWRWSNQTSTHEKSVTSGPSRCHAFWGVDVWLDHLQFDQNCTENGIFRFDILTSTNKKRDTWSY